jgi:transposase-like protein
MRTYICRVVAADVRIRIVMESLTTNITLAELCRKYNLNQPTEIYRRQNGINWFR